MGHEKEKQMADDAHVRAHLPKCQICDAPVEGYGEKLCYGCREALSEDK